MRSKGSDEEKKKKKKKEKNCSEREDGRSRLWVKTMTREHKAVDMKW